MAKKFWQTQESVRWDVAIERLLKSMPENSFTPQLAEGSEVSGECSVGVKSGLLPMSTIILDAQDALSATRTVAEQPIVSKS